MAAGICARVRVSGVTSRGFCEEVAMSHRSFWVALIVALLAAFAGGHTVQAMAQQPPVTISGRVFDGTGAGVPGVQIEFGLVGGGPHTTLTDSSGNYSIDVVPGTYVITLTRNGPPGTGAFPSSFQIFINNFYSVSST